MPSKRRLVTSEICFGAEKAFLLDVSYNKCALIKIAFDFTFYNKLRFRYVNCNVTSKAPCLEVFLYMKIIQRNNEITCYGKSTCYLHTVLPLLVRPLTIKLASFPERAH